MSSENIGGPFCEPNPALANLVRVEYFDERGLSYFVEYRLQDGFDRVTAGEAEPVVLPFLKAA